MMETPPLASWPDWVQRAAESTWLTRRIALWLWGIGGNHTRGYLDPFGVTDAQLEGEWKTLIAKRQKR